MQFWDHPLSSENGKIVFNPIKTWTEYLNRLLGVIIGFGILLQAVLCFPKNRGSRARIFSLVSLVLVLFQGWLGARVVSSDLRPLVISLHLFIALLIALSLLLALYFSSPAKESFFGPFPAHRFSKTLLSLSSILLLVQFFLGTEVRSQVDVLFRQFDFASRELYADRLDLKFILHRSFSLLTLLVLFLQFRVLSKRFRVEKVWLTMLPIGLVFLLLLSGVILIYLGFPAFAQPFHLLFGFSVICAQFWLCLHYLLPHVPEYRNESIPIE